MYSVKKIDDITIWEDFVKKQKYSPFVQSNQYGAFYESMGESYTVFGLYKDAVLVGGSLVLTTHAKRGDFFYLPYGPFLDYTNIEQVSTFVHALEVEAKSQRMDFIRISPFFADSKEGRLAIASLGFRPAPMHVLAENSWLLDLSKDTDKLLADMKKNHRNLIRRCEKKGVRIEMRSDIEALNLLHTMLDSTSKRLGFVRFSPTYINNEFDKFARQNQASIFVSYLPDGTPDAAAIIFFYGNMAVYRHSASLNMDKKIPTSYLIQWYVIQEAKNRGMKWYNFWGVEPVGAGPKHPFAGIGHFKRGFGGFQEDLLHCQDLPLTKKYWLNWLVESIRKARRGF